MAEAGGRGGAELNNPEEEEEAILSDIPRAPEEALSWECSCTEQHALVSQNTCNALAGTASEGGGVVLTDTFLVTLRGHIWDDAHVPRQGRIEPLTHKKL